jgi:hypothetical protein
MKATGYLRQVEAYSSDDGPEVAIEKVFGSTPSVLVQYTGDTVTPDSNLPGAFYKDVLHFKLLIICANLRPSPATTQGSPIAGEDPGAYRVIGDLRRLVCGIAPTFGVDGVERVEIGDSELLFEDIDRRLFVWSLGINVRASFDIQDEDLADIPIEAQPALTDAGPSRIFDAANYIASGGGLDDGEGPGLSRNIDVTIAVIGGTALFASATPATFAAHADTYRDLAPEGTWAFSAVAAGAAQPAKVDGQLRVGVTRTDATGVLYDKALCSYSIPFGSPIPIPAQ